MRILVFLFLFIGHLSADVVAHFRGQLGNQLFQAAAALSLALDNDCGVNFPDFTKFDDPLWGPEWDLRKNYVYFFKNFPFQVPNRNPSLIYQEPGPGYYPISYQPNIEIDGYFLSEKYFYKHRDLIKQLYAPPEEIEADLRRDFSCLIDAPNTVAVHVRTGYYDYKLGNFDPDFYSRYLRPDLEYYKSAIKSFDSNYTFVFFSDYMPWCKKHFQGLDRKFIFIEGQDYIHDFFLITLCKHVIIANSSFGWWAAYLNSNPDKKIICRSPYYGYLNERTNDLVCDDWLRIPGSTIIPFPNFD